MFINLVTVVDENRLHDRLIANVPGFDLRHWSEIKDQWFSDVNSGRVERVPNSGIIRVDYPEGVTEASIRAEEALERAL